MKFLYRKFADNTNEDSVSYRFREARFNRFVKTLDLDKNDNILDVGGVESTWIGSGFEKRITLLNLKFGRKLKEFSYVTGNACNMKMFPDKSFSVVYSNSVIEHVGEALQKNFAEEIMRVGKKYWVQTPFKHFPVEPHFLFPFFQYLPFSVKKIFALRWPYSHYKMYNSANEEILKELSLIHLLNRKALSNLFPGSKIYEEKFLGITKSLVAFKN